VVDGARDIPERPEALLEITRLAEAGVGRDGLLTAVADIVSRAVGFRTVAVNLYRHARNEFEVVAVHGNDNAALALLGTVTAAETWDSLLDDRFDVAGAHFVPAGAVDWSLHDQATFIPEPTPAAAAHDAWQPEDCLFAALRRSHGELLGILSLDEPENGRRPGADNLAVLASIATHVAGALEAAEANDVQRREPGAPSRRGPRPS